MIQIVHPAVLWGLLAALVPIAIYLLLRRRKTEVRWGASYLLRLTLASKKRASIWRQIVVLAIRCLILALMAILLAQVWRPNPHPSNRQPAPPPGPVHRAILIDNSLSMSCRDGEETRADRMRTALTALLESQRPGDSATLVRLIPETPDVHAAPVTVTGAVPPAKIRALADSIRLREGTVTLSLALEEALERLSSTPGASQEIYIFSDFPRELDADLDHTRWVGESVKARRLRMVPVNVAGTASPVANLAIQGLSLGTDEVIAGVPLTLYIDVANCSDTNLFARLAIEQKGQKAAVEEVTLQPNERRKVVHSITFDAPGPTFVRVGATDGRLDVDTRCSLSVNVRRPVVWLVAGKAEGFSENKVGEGEFLRQVFRPQGKESKIVQLEEADLRQLFQAIPDTVDAIVMAGVPLGAPLGQPIVDFVRGGGGLIVAMSPDVAPAAYQESLGPLLPAELDQPWRDAVDPEVFLSVRAMADKGISTLFDEFATERNGNVADIRVYNYMRVRNPDGAREGVLRLSNGDPYLLHRPVGRGHVYVVLSSLGISWSSLPVQQIYLPFLHRVIGAALAGRGFPRNLEPGAPFVSPWKAGEAATVTLPDADVRPAAGIQGPARSFIMVESTGERGLHKIQGAAGHEDYFTIRGAFPEGDLRTVSASQAQTLGDALGAPLYGGWAQAVQALGAADHRMPWWPWILALLLALYGFETWFVRWL